MAISIAAQTTALSSTVNAEILISPTAGNWLVLVVSWTTLDSASAAPAISVADYARNLWTLAWSSTQQAYTTHPTALLYTQVWVCPNVRYEGWNGQLGVYVSAINIPAYDVGNVATCVYEVAGMSGGALTVDSVTTATASAATALSMTSPTPQGGADCLVLAGVGVDNNTVTLTSTGAGFTALTGVNASGAQSATPPVQTAAAWQESTLARTSSWTSSAACNWVGNLVAIRQTGIAPSQPNPSWPAIEVQLGLGYSLSTPTTAIAWTTIQNRLLALSHERGYQFEMGMVQSSPTDLQLRNDDGAFTPRPAGAGTATANGTTSTLLVSDTDAASITVTDFFQLTTSGGVLKETTVFQVTGKTPPGSGTTTITFQRADQTGSGASVATATGDKYSGCPIDIYVPFRVLATWSGKRYPVATGWVERWPQVWKDPHWGETPTVGIDAIATLTAADVNVVQGEILSRKPHDYWPLNDAAGSTFGQNMSGVGIAPLVQTQGKYGTGANGAAQFGASTQTLPTGSGGPPAYAKTSIIGDQGNGWAQTGLAASDYPKRGTALIARDRNFPSIAGGVTVFGCLYTPTDEINKVQTATVQPTMFVVRGYSGSGQQITQIKLSAQNGVTNTGWPVITVWDKVTHTSTPTVVNASLIGPFSWWTWAVTFNQTGWSYYNNGLYKASGSCNLAASFGQIDLSGEADPSATGYFFNATLAHVAIFPRMLTAQEIADLTSSVMQGTPSNTTGEALVAKKLAYAGWRGPRLTSRGAFNTGTDAPASTIAEKIAQIADREDGKLFADAAGVLQFRNLRRTYKQVPRATLGDRPDLGEIPYLGEGSLRFDYDPTFLYNKATIANQGVTQAWGPASNVTNATATNATSQQRYGARTLGKSVSLANSSQAFALAWWYLIRYATPKLRLATVKIDAAKSGASVSATWPFIFGVEVGDLVTVNRRPIGAPAISIACIVLSVKHSSAHDHWETDLILAPAPPSVLTLNDATYGIVGNNAIGA